jgi:hypothetical protein
MLIHKRALFIFTSFFLFAGLLSSCYKKDIQVGGDIVESYTRIITVDTSTVMLSSYVVDSFKTSGSSVMLLGGYQDSYLGNTTSNSYFQVGLPTFSQDVTTVIPGHALFDSIVLYMKPSGYYYGDTTKPFSIRVQQLAIQPQYTNESSNANIQGIYNTHSIADNGSFTVNYSKVISPRRNDSVKITLPNFVGEDLLTKLRNRTVEVSTADNFLEYFKGLKIQTTTPGQGAVYGFNLNDSSVRIRLHFHVNTPVREARTIEFFPTRTTHQFNEIKTDRTGTPLQGAGPGKREFFASTANPYSLTQPGTGVMLKATFPYLRELLKLNERVRLMDAKLILKPVKGTYDLGGYRLPEQVFLATTGNTNEVQSQLLDTIGNTPQYRNPVIDYINGFTANYTFSITSYANALLNTPGSNEQGLFIINAVPGAATQLNRAVIGSRQNPNYSIQLVLNLLTIE